MSTSFIYQAYGMIGYQYLRTTYTNGKVIISVQKNPHKTICSCCQSSSFIRKGKVKRMFKAVPIGKKPVLLEVVIQRILCLGCGSLKQEKITFADSRKTYTHAFERYVLELSKLMTIQDVALHLGISWDTVKGIQKQYLLKNFGKPKLKHLTYLAIDEISIGKHHRYLTVVLDLVTGAVVFVGEGKKAESLSPFWKKLKSSRAKIKAVAIDMSPAYIEALRTHLPQATVVFDHFHVIKYYNDKLSELRRNLYREITDSLEKNILKGTRWLLLKNPENLDETKNEHDRLKKALQINQPLATAYYLKEDLRQLWFQKNKEQAQIHLDHWIAKASCSGIKILEKFAETLASHQKGILAFYDHPISTGPLEAVNNKINVMKRQAYGFRDHAFLKLKIQALHQSRYALIG
jgi:transposase